MGVVLADAGSTPAISTNYYHKHKRLSSYFGLSLFLGENQTFQTAHPYRILIGIFPFYGQGDINVFSSKTLHRHAPAFRTDIANNERADTACVAWD